MTTVPHQAAARLCYLETWLHLAGKHHLKYSKVIGCFFYHIKYHFFIQHVIKLST